MGTVEGAKAYEPVLPASALSGGDKYQVIKVTTPAGTVELPGNLLPPASAAGHSTISLVIGAIDKSAFTSAELKEAAGDRPALQLSLKADGKAVSWDNKAARVKVSIPYTPNSEEQKNSEYLVIRHIDGAGHTVKIPLTKYNAETGLVSFVTSVSGQFILTYEMESFTDGGMYLWARHSIEVLASKGIIEGTSDTSFSPGENISRADFLVLLVRTLGLTADFSNNFGDVSPADYYYEALGVAKKLGISEGAEENSFNPKDPITRQDLMVLSARALQIADVLSKQGTGSELPQFNDSSDIAPYAEDSIATMVKEGIVTGNGDNLAPLVNATRAETAVIMYRIFHKL